MALTAETAGKAQFALVRSGRIAAQGGISITKPGTLGFKLKLPKKLKAGSLQPAHHVHADRRGEGVGQDDQDHLHGRRRRPSARRRGRAAGTPRLSAGDPGVPGRRDPSVTPPSSFR